MTTNLIRRTCLARLKKLSTFICFAKLMTHYQGSCATYSPKRLTSLKSFACRNETVSTSCVFNFHRQQRYFFL